MKKIVVSLCLLLGILLVVAQAYVENRIEQADKLVIKLDYTVKLEECPGNDPFAGDTGFLAHTFLGRILAEGYAYYRNFEVTSPSSTIITRAYSIVGVTQQEVIQRLVFSFTTTQTTALTIFSTDGVNNRASLIINTRTYEAYVSYRYVIRFPYVVTAIPPGGSSIISMLGIPTRDAKAITLTYSFYNNQGSVSLTPTVSVIYVTPSSGSMSWTVSLKITFNSVNDVGKSFTDMIIKSSCASCSPSWSDLIHVWLSLDPNYPFVITDVGDSITIVFNIVLTT